MTPLSTLSTAITACEADPHGGKVMLDLDTARALRDGQAAPEGDAISRVLPNAFYECAGCTQQGSEINCRPAEDIRLAPDETWLCEYCYDDAAFECGEDANWPVWADLPKLSAALRSLPPQDGEREASALVALQAMVDTFHPAMKEVDDERIAAIARAEKAEAALAGARAIIRAGADLLSVEVDALKSGISINGEVKAGPEDAATVEAIAEFEAWIADAAGFVNGASALTAQPVAQVAPPAVMPDASDNQTSGDAHTTAPGAPEALVHSAVLHQNITGDVGCATPAPVEADQQAVMDRMTARRYGRAQSAPVGGEVKG